MHPILIYITKDFYIGTYGVMIAIGVFLGLFLAARRGKTIGFSEDFILDLSFYMILSGIIGARLLFLIMNFQRFLEDPAGMAFSREGFVFLGGFITAIIVGWIYIKKKKISFLKVADVLAPSLPLGHFFGRIGCFFAGCCYGKVCPPNLSFIGVSFPAVVNKKGELIGSFPYIDHLQQKLISPDSTYSLPIFPTQLIEALANLIIFIILNHLFKKRKFDGHITALYLVLYPVARFFIEFLRGDADRKIWFGFISTSQILSIFFIAIAIWIFKTKSKKPKVLKKTL